MTKQSRAHLRIVSSTEPTGSVADKDCGEFTRGPPRSPLKRIEHAVYRFGPNVLIGLAVTACLTVGVFYAMAGPLVIAPFSRSTGIAGSGGAVSPASTEIVAWSPLVDAVIQNTPGYSEGYALGVPRGYDWCNGSLKSPETSAPPSNFTAVTGWGQVYAMVGASYLHRAGIIEIAGAKTWLRLKDTHEWVVVQDQASHPFEGAYFVPDFSPKAAIALELNKQPQERLEIGLPPLNRNVHFWMRQRGTYAAGSVDAVYVEMDVRTTDPELSFVANVGADWWRDPTIDFEHGFKNNPGAGMSNWVRLSTEWSTLRFYSASTPELIAAPPPPLTATGAAVTRTRAALAAPCNQRPFEPLPKELIAPPGP